MKVEHIQTGMIFEMEEQEAVNSTIKDDGIPWFNLGKLVAERTSPLEIICK